MGNNSKKVRYKWRLDQIEEVKEMREIGVNLLQKVSQLSVVVKKILEEGGFNIGAEAPSIGMENVILPFENLTYENPQDVIMGLNTYTMNCYKYAEWALKTKKALIKKTKIDTDSGRRLEILCHEIISD